ncbi:hypothetical protein K432DRAFT_122394 [Lepidopterella palustris CBS 459.81]|uniref:Uncharacterized protein n=1 Tax=Lepidopterella palustris CBS 459.81 TaxID=1314670 RepID=A0A8E2E533_9PEZI|nr:hypothetical protein K432DRAFT_122394 [Lepidopterella palustris CBS 459.81]
MAFVSLALHIQHLVRALVDLLYFRANQDPGFTGSGRAALWCFMGIGAVITRSTGCWTGLALCCLGIYLFIYGVWVVLDLHFANKVYGRDITFIARSSCLSI